MVNIPIIIIVCNAENSDTHLTPATGKARGEERRGEGRGGERKGSRGAEGKRCRKEGEREEMGSDGEYERGI